MINKITLTFVMAIISSASAFALTDAEQKQVDHLVMLFKQNHPQKIALSIQYPLRWKLQFLLFKIPQRWKNVLIKSLMLS